MATVYVAPLWLLGILDTPGAPSRYGLVAAFLYWAAWWPSLASVVRNDPDGSGWRSALAPLMFMWDAAEGMEAKRAVRSVLLYGVMLAVILGLFAVFTWFIRFIQVVAGAAFAVIAVRRASSRVSGWAWRRRTLAGLGEAVSARQAVVDCLRRGDPRQGVWLLRVVRSRNRLVLGPDDAPFLLRIVALADGSMLPTVAAEVLDRRTELVRLLGAPEGLARSILSIGEVEELGRWIEEIQQSEVAVEG